MKKIILSLAITLLFDKSFGQNRANELQILPFTIINWHPEFSFNYGGRASTDYLKMRGISPGINISYKYAIKPDMKIIGGLGYYQYSFNKLKRINSVFGPSDSRPIEYPSMIQVFYQTNNYQYNSISINLGIEKLFNIRKDIQLSTGLNLSNFFTFSQVYKLTFDNIIYRTNNKSLFAQSFTIITGIEKKMGKLKVGPQLIIPLFDIWHKESVFLEKSSEKRSKWLNGIGIGVQINYPLTKK